MNIKPPCQISGFIIIEKARTTRARWPPFLFHIPVPLFAWSNAHWQRNNPGSVYGNCWDTASIYMFPARLPVYNEDTIPVHQQLPNTWAVRPTVRFASRFV